MAKSVGCFLPFCFLPSPPCCCACAGFLGTAFFLPPSRCCWLLAPPFWGCWPLPPPVCCWTCFFFFCCWLPLLLPLLLLLLPFWPLLQPRARAYESGGVVSTGKA